MQYRLHYFTSRENPKIVVIESVIRFYYNKVVKPSTNSSSRGVMATRLTSNQKIMGSTPIVSALFLP